MKPIKQWLAALAGHPAEAAAASPAIAPEMLQPVSDAMPCGESLDNDGDYALLQSRLAPRADVQYGHFSARPEAPDWPVIEREARQLLLRSKDISVLVSFTRARCRTAGTAGLLEGLGTLHAVLQAYPEQVHPQLVLDGLPDPAVRANALAALCDPEGLLGDIRQLVVCAGTAFRLTVRDVERAFAFPRPPYAPEPEGVRRQLADLHAKGDAALLELLAAAHQAQAIDQWSKRVLQDEAPSLTPVLNLLAALASFTQPAPPVTKLQAEDVAPGPERRTAGMPAASQEEFPSPGPGAPAIASFIALPTASPGQHDVVQEREQIRASLRLLRQWIERHEPSSPAAILLKQAERMWGRRFSEVAGMIPAELMREWDRED